MTDLRAFVAFDHTDQGNVYGPFDFARGEQWREEYYTLLDECEGHSGMEVVELIKRPNGDWEPIGPQVDNKLLAEIEKSLQGVIAGSLLEGVMAIIGETARRHSQ